MHVELQNIVENDAARPVFSKLQTAFREAIPLLDELENTPQEPDWHGEGNVAIHTAMVLDETRRFFRFSTPQERLILTLAALLHDVAKPLTTCVREFDGRERIVAPRHAGVGRSYLACRLMALELPYDVVRSVLALVGYHHDPMKLVRREASPGKFIALAWRVNPRLVYRLEMADMRGRECLDQQEQLDQLELFSLMNEEYGVLGPEPHPYLVWASALPSELREASPEVREKLLVEGMWDHAASRITTLHEAVARSYRWREGRLPRLLLTVGASGAGKSTYVREHLRDEGFEVISLDEIRVGLTGSRGSQKRNDEVLRIARHRLKVALRARRDVIWEATSLRRDFRDAVVAEGLRYGAHITLVVFHMPPDAFYERNAARDEGVSETVLRHQLERWQWPEIHEAHRLIFVGSDGQTLFDTRSVLLKDEEDTP